MKYEWQGSEDANALCREADYLASGRLRVVGIAVYNTETGEAATFEIPDLLSDIERADAWQDILGDAHTIYRDSVKALRK